MIEIEPIHFNKDSFGSIDAEWSCKRRTVAHIFFKQDPEDIEALLEFIKKKLFALSPNVEWIHEPDIGIERSVSIDSSRSGPFVEDLLKELFEELGKASQ